MSSNNLEVLEICAGAGGQALGLEKAGFDHLAAVEIDQDACNTLRVNRPDWRILEGDVTDKSVFEPAGFEGVDLLAAGVPCPPFSIAGRQFGAEDERDLFAYTVNLAAAIRPTALLLENVRGLAAKRFAGYRAHILDILKDNGYWSEWRVLHASGYGVPQLRPRFILIALKHDYAPYFAWPEPDDASTPKVGETIVDLIAADGWGGSEAWRDAAGGVAPTIVGGSKKHGGADLGPTRAKLAWRKLSVDGMGIADAPPTKKMPKNHHPRLTNEMVARIQGWATEDNWRFSGRKTSTYRQIGNAFPPPVAHQLGKQISRALGKQGNPTDQRAREEQADERVYRILTSASKDFIAINVLGEAAGLDASAVNKVLSHLKSDFLLDQKKNRGIEYVRLLNFKGSAAH